MVERSRGTSIVREAARSMRPRGQWTWRRLAPTVALCVTAIVACNDQEPTGPPAQPINRLAAVTPSPSGVGTGSSLDRSPGEIARPTGPRVVNRGDRSAVFDEAGRTLSHRGKVVRLDEGTVRALKELLQRFDETDRIGEWMRVDPQFNACLAAYRASGKQPPMTRVRKQSTTSERPASASMTSGRRLLNDWTTFADYTDDDASTCQNLSVAIYQAQMDAQAAETTLWNTILLGMADGLQWINGGWNWSGVSQLTKALYQVALADVSAKRLALNILVIQFSANNCWQWQSSGWYDGGEPVGQVSFGGLTCHQEYVYLEEYVPGFGWQTLWEGWADVCE